VGALALRLGRALREAPGWDLDLDVLGRAGLLHDIGKLRVPWSLLNKVAPITPKEWTLLKDHSLHGADLLSKMGMGEVGVVVLQHHEFLDGSGYPDGRAPDRMAAVVAVCDAYEATVTPNRRYKVAKGFSQALGELKRDAGQLYHPEVVGALAAVLDGGAA
jgi:HD-GYP domain-containing protein (c-di-GMP phosphodiesterase class II)